MSDCERLAAARTAERTNLYVDGSKDAAESGKDSDRNPGSSARAMCHGGNDADRRQHENERGNANSVQFAKTTKNSIEFGHTPNEHKLSRGERGRAWLRIEEF